MRLSALPLVSLRRILLADVGVRPMALAPRGRTRYAPLRASNPQPSTTMPPSGGLERPVLPSVGRHLAAINPEELDGPLTCKARHDFLAEGAT